MKALQYYYACPRKAGEAGIEFEVEFKGRVPFVPDGWVMHDDQSLRGMGGEYVTDGPILLDEKRHDIVKPMLDEIMKSDPILDSPRTSVHVHMNMIKMTPVQIWTAIVAYWLCEPLLFKFCGQEREGNLFCLRLSDAEGIIPMCLADINANYPFTSLLENDQVRYAGLNINALRKFGSIEFRGMRGVYDYETVDAWLLACKSIAYSPGNLFSNPEHMLDQFYKMEKPEFLAQIFGAKFRDTLCSYPDWYDMLEEGAMCVLPLAYDVDWDSWVARMERERLVLKNRPGLNRNHRAAPVRQPAQRPQPGVNWFINDELNLAPGAVLDMDAMRRAAQVLQNNQWQAVQADPDELMDL
jgi:hypothetical protein